MFDHLRRKADHAAVEIDFGAVGGEDLQRLVVLELEAEIAEQFETGEMDALDLFLAQNLERAEAVLDPAPGHLLRTGAAPLAHPSRPHRFRHHARSPGFMSARLAQQGSLGDEFCRTAGAYSSCCLSVP